MSIETTLLQLEAKKSEPPIQVVSHDMLSAKFNGSRRKDADPIDRLRLYEAGFASLADESIARLGDTLRTARARCLLATSEEMWQEAMLHAPDNLEVYSDPALRVLGPTFTSSQHPALRGTIRQVTNEWRTARISVKNSNTAVVKALCSARAVKLWRKSGLMFGHVVDAFPELDTRWCWPAFR